MKLLKGEKEIAINSLSNLIMPEIKNLSKTKKF